MIVFTLNTHVNTLIRGSKVESHEYFFVYFEMYASCDNVSYLRKKKISHFLDLNCLFQFELAWRAHTLNQPPFWPFLKCAQLTSAQIKCASSNIISFYAIPALIVELCAWLKS